jgi:hypothetical protein
LDKVDQYPALTKGRAIRAAKREQARLAAANGGATTPKRSPGRKTSHGLHALKQKIAVRGLDAVRRDTLGGKLIFQWRQELTDALGGADQVSPQQRTLVELACRAKLFVDHVDSWLMEQPSLIFKKRNALMPVLVQRTQLAASLEKTIMNLGLQRVAKKLPSFDEYMKELEAKKEAERKAAEREPITVAAVQDQPEPAS